MLTIPQYQKQSARNNTVRRLCLVLTLFIFSLASHAQNAIISGQATDTSGNILTNATILLEKLSPHPPFRKMISQKTKFVFRSLSIGEYSLTISFTEYRDTTIFIAINEKDSVYNIGQVKLQDKQQLMEVVVRAVLPPVTIKSDTIVYNASSYKTRPNATVEELLKKLPGIDVDKEGNITFQGEKVEKIYIEGKEFMLKDPKMVTRNFLADMIEKVEAFDEKSERAKRAGVRDTKPGKSINFRLKPDKNHGYFGNLSSAAATGERYDISGTLNYFKSDRQFMSVLDVNDGGNLINDGAPLPNTKAMQATVNYSDRLNKKTMLNVGYMGNRTRSAGEITSERQSFFSDSSLIQSHNSKNGADNQLHNLNLSLGYTIDTFSTLLVVGSMTINDISNNSFEIAGSSIEKNGINKPLNEALNRNRQDNRNTTGNIHLNYIRTFRKRGRYLQAGINPGFTQSNGNGELYSLTRFFNEDPAASDSSVRDQRSLQKGNGYSFNATVVYVEPLSKRSAIDMSYVLNRSNNTDDRHTLNYNTATGKYDSPDSLATNYFKGNNNSHLFSLGYTYHIKKLQYQVGASVQKSTIANSNTAQGMGNYNQQMTNIFPRGMLVYMIDKRKMLDINYRGETEQPTVEQLQPAPDYNNPLLIKKGNPDLKQAFRNNININYRIYNSANASSFLANVVVNTFANQIMSSIVTNERGIQEQQYLNTNGNYNITGSGSYSFPLSKTNMKANVVVTSSLGYGRSVSFINGAANNTNSIIGSQIVKINYAPGEKLVTGFSGSLKWNNSKYSLPGSQKSSVLTHRYQADASYEILPGLLVHSDVNILLNRSTPQLGGEDITVWNARLSKMLFKQKGELKFTVYDILNNNKNIKQVSANNYIERIETQVVQRVYMLSFVYRFRKFGI